MRADRIFQILLEVIQNFAGLFKVLKYFRRIQISCPAFQNFVLEPIVVF